MGDRFRQYLNLVLARRQETRRIGATRERYDQLGVDQIVDLFNQYLDNNFRDALRHGSEGYLRTALGSVRRKHESGIRRYDLKRRTGESRPMDVWAALAPHHPRDDFISALDGVVDEIARKWHAPVRPRGSGIGTLKATVRPLQPGYSVSYQGSLGSGTLGGFIRSRGKIYLLSNAHILASNPFADSDTPGVVQPSTADGGTQVVARVVHHSPIRHGDNNELDAAIAQVAGDVQVLAEYPEIGVLTGFRNPRVGETVRMVGRTSGYIQAVVEEVDHDGRVVDWTNPYHHIGFRGLTVMTRGHGTYTNREGDSGGLWIGEDNKAVALNFAGGEDSDHAMAIPIARVMAFVQKRLGDGEAGLMGISNSTLYKLT